MKIFRALALSLLLAAGAIAQNAGLMPVPNQQFFSSSGTPLAGGLIYTCVAGASCPGNPLTTYTDSTAGTANANPVVLDAGGFASIWLGSAAYKIVAQDADAVTQWTVDGVQNLGLAALSGLSTFPSISVSGNAGVTGNLATGTLNVNGAASLGALSATSLTTTGAVTVGTNESVAGTLGVTGATTLASTLAVTGNTTLSGMLAVNGNRITFSGGAQATQIRLNATGNTDLSGIVILSSGTATYTFAGTYLSPPFCVATDTAAVAAVKATATTTTLTITGTGSDTVDYMCIART